MPAPIWGQIHVPDASAHQYDRKTRSVFFLGYIERNDSRFDVIIGAQEHQGRLHKATIAVGSLHADLYPNGEGSKKLNRQIISEAIEKAVVKRAHQKLALQEEEQTRQIEEAKLDPDSEFNATVDQALKEVLNARAAYMNEDARHAGELDQYVEKINARYKDKYTYYSVNVAGVGQPFICVGGETSERLGLDGSKQTYYRTIGEKGDCMWSRFPSGISVETTIDSSQVVSDEKGRKPFHMTVRIGKRNIFIPVHIKDAKLIAKDVAARAPKRFMDWEAMMQEISDHYDGDVIVEVMRRYKEEYPDG